MVMMPVMAAMMGLRIGRNHRTSQNNECNSSNKQHA
jgi:hypothetical protein